MAFRKKSIFIEKYQPDILVVPECEHPDKLKFAAGSQIPTNIFWFGDNPHKGIGVFSFTNFKISLLDFHQPEFKLILPLKCTNEQETYTVFAIWANNPSDRGNQYVGQIWKAINHYQNQISTTKTLLLGDFNSNSIWDRPRRLGNHTNVVDFLAKKGIQSVYHQYFNQQQSKEIHPTHFLYRHEDKPYHLDYCFVSKDLINRLKKVEIGLHHDWKIASDHMPIIIDFE
jgi:exonuclease III